MPTRKKKVSSNYIKQSEAHYKKVFSQKVLTMAKIVSETKSSKMITGKMLDVIYSNRVRSLKVVAENNLNIPSNILKEIRESIFSHLKSHVFAFDTGEKIEYYDFLGPVLSLWRLLDFLKEKKSEEYSQLLKDFSEFVETDEMFREVEKFLHKVCDNVGWKFSSWDKKLYSLKLTFKTSDSPEENLYPEVKVLCFPAQQINACINGSNRPAYRVGLTVNGSEEIWCNLKGFAGTFGLRHLSPKTSIPVYIQHHALNRLSERIDCVNHKQRFIYLANSIDKKECIYYHGHWLLAYYFDMHKIGYLMLDVVNDKAVIRTFLLLTSFDTPEGDSLREIIGLEKPDMSFLNLDKLSTFVFSGIRDKPLLCDLFTRGGCGSLIEVPQDDSVKKSNPVNCTTIESYLGKYNDHKVRLKLEDLLETCT